jgi:hypothetical protein
MSAIAGIAVVGGLFLVRIGFITGRYSTVDRILLLYNDWMIAP